MRPTAAQKDKENVEGDGDDDAPKEPEAPTEPAASNAAPP